MVDKKHLTDGFVAATLQLQFAPALPLFVLGMDSGGLSTPQTAVASGNPAGGCDLIQSVVEITSDS